jgi:hypothetical protein
MTKINIALGWAFAISLFLIFHSKGISQIELWLGIILMGVVLIGVFV